MTIKLGFCAKNGIFYIETNGAIDEGFDTSEHLELDDFVQLIFDSRLPYHLEVYSNEHDLIRYDYHIMIHQSLIHCGENEPAIFSTTDRPLTELIQSLVVPGQPIPMRAKRMSHRESVWYNLTIGKFKKGILRDAPRNS